MKSVQQCFHLQSITSSLRIHLIHKIPGHTDSVLSLSTAPWDPGLFASSSKDNTFILWHVDSNDDEEIKAKKVIHEFGVICFYSYKYFCKTCLIFR